MGYVVYAWLLLAPAITVALVIALPAESGPVRAAAEGLMAWWPGLATLATAAFASLLRTARTGS